MDEALLIKDTIVFTIVMLNEMVMLSLEACAVQTFPAPVDAAFSVVWW